MKTTILALATALITAAVFPKSANAQSEEKLKPGDNLPDYSVSMRNATGPITTIKASGGQNGLLVMFSCNTCPFVIKNQPITKKTMEYAAVHHVGMVIINSNQAKRGDDDSYAAMQKYGKEQEYTVPYLVDENSQVADLFGANHTPEVFLFNNKGKLVYKGAMNDNPGNPSEYKKAYIENAIDAMLAGKEVDPKSTKSIGCSIKRKTS